MTSERDAARASVLREVEDWEPRAGESLVDLVVTFRMMIDGVRDCGFSVASCFFCSLATPKREVSRCPACGTMVGRDGRRRMQRPTVCGLPVPEGGFSPEVRKLVEARVTEDVQRMLAERLGRAVPVNLAKN